jgi:hypothetical protein
LFEECKRSCSAGVLACEFRHRPGARNGPPANIWRRDSADTRTRDGRAIFISESSELRSLGVIQSDGHLHQRASPSPSPRPSGERAGERGYRLTSKGAPSNLRQKKRIAGTIAHHVESHPHYLPSFRQFDTHAITNSEKEGTRDLWKSQSSNAPERRVPLGLAHPPALDANPINHRVIPATRSALFHPIRGGGARPRSLRKTKNYQTNPFSFSPVHCPSTTWNQTVSNLGQKRTHFVRPRSNFKKSVRCKDGKSQERRGTTDRAPSPSPRSGEEVVLGEQGAKPQSTSESFLKTAC